MSKVLAFVAAWFVAAVVALVVAWQGVAIVTDQVTEQRPAPLSAGEIKSSEKTETPPSIPVSTLPAPSTTVRVVEARTATSSTVATVPSTTTTTTAAASTPSTTTPSTSSSSVTRTYTLVGGSASLKFSPSGVTVNWANPNPGFDVKVEPENGNGVKVEFESNSHRSRVDGWWADGPQDRVREEDR